MVTKTEFGYVRPTQIEEEMRTSYLDYAMSVIVSRALPDVRDGLKPVQRRILYAMHDMGMRSGSSYKKSARLVGEVLGKYHPHGDSPVYDAMVRMAQPFSMRVPLVDGQGNFGSVDNDPPAAMRYTEARLSAAAEMMMANLDQDTVDFVDNFDGSLKEPVVLPARLPNLLINGAAGIAVGMATSIPPHNATEVCNGVIQLIDNPDATLGDLMRYVRGPDFPTGATIMGRDGIKSAYSTGRGQIVVQATAEVEETKRSDRERIVVTELPYQVNKAALIQKIAALIKAKRVDGISEIRDESDRRGMRIVMELRSGTQPRVVLNNLYKHTAMQSTFSANMIALVDGAPEIVTLKQTLQHYIDFRREVVRRRSLFELRKARQRAHILEGLRIALSNLDAIIALIRNAMDVEEARNGLMERFDLDQAQAQAILDMQLRRLAALERERIEEEYQQLQARIRDLEELLANPWRVLAVVRSETEELKKKVRGARMTSFGGEAEEFDRAALEPHQQVVVTLSKAGYIKRIPAATYRSQHRGGKGVVSMTRKEDDPVNHILIVDTHDTLLFFTDRGRVLPLVSYELKADTSRTVRGVPVVNVIPVADESVSSVIAVTDMHEQGRSLVMATRKGTIKRIDLEQISNVRKSGVIVMNLRDDDELVAARLAGEDDDVIMVSQMGMSIRFPVAEVRTRQRVAGGVRGMELGPGDRIVAMDVVVPNSKLLVVSRKGFGKLTDLNRYRRQGRGGSGITTLKITRKTGRVAAAEVIADSDELYIVSEKAQVIRTNLSEIRTTKERIAQGVTIFKPEPGDAVASIACIRDLKELEEAAASTAKNGKTNGRVPKNSM